MSQSLGRISIHEDKTYIRMFRLGGVWKSPQSLSLWSSTSRAAQDLSNEPTPIVLAHILWPLGPLQLLPILGKELPLAGFDPATS